VPGSHKQPAQGARDVAADPGDAPKRFERKRACGVCGVALSAYNEGPNCYRHSVGMPWRGPSAKPKLD
jgi:hypothetical protein